MKKDKTSIFMDGTLLRPLAVGQSAIVHAGGKLYHTSRVVAIQEQTKNSVRFETLHSFYHLSTSPFALAVMHTPPALSLAA